MIIYGEEHNDLCVGIDLGTTNSVLATINVKQNGDAVSKVVEIPRAVDIYSTVSAEAKLSSQKKPTLPSCVYYREEKNFEPLVGDFAKIQYPLRPHLVAKSIKSQMGKPDTEGLSADIPDKTPAKVSSRILNHLLRNAEKIYKCQISDAVITVPANFDSVMCKATRDAAELAGIKVKNEDGSERPVLLSEPNAVIYDLINQIHNGEISNRIIDLTTKKNVLVFDLGGGTLDITMHEIKRRDDFQEVLKVDEIATNRYTLLGGDDFDEMFEIYLNGEIVNANLKLKKNELSVVLFVGVNGVGKTTSIAKIAYAYKKLGKKVLLAAGDTFRAGAIEQLSVWAKRVGVDIVTKEAGSDPSSVIFEACKKAKQEGYDLLLCDTAGRLQNKVNLMNELSKMKRVIENVCPGAPDETLLVIDATTGQNGMSQAKAFKEATAVTGIILTKLDGTSKGGIVLAIRHEMGIPIKYIGLGESLEDLEVFDIEQYLYGLFADFFEE